MLHLFFNIFYADIKVFRWLHRATELLEASKGKMLILFTSFIHDLLSRCAGEFDRRLPVRLRADVVQNVLQQKTSCTVDGER